jgi:hypothetical protein
MSDVNGTDGWYYAIKWFAYQVDKTILEILSTQDECKKINIEQIQDIDSDDFVIQVKYKETAKLIPSQVNKPISQLLNEFKIDNNKRYILYAYFNDLNGYNEKICDNKITKEILDELLWSLKDNFTEIDKTGFIEKFELDLSEEFQEQFLSVIDSLCKKWFWNNQEESTFYYANIVDYLYKIVINNAPKRGIHNRTCTPKEIFEYLRQWKKIIFNEWFREYQGEQKYFSFIKTKYFSTTRNINNYERFIIIELTGDENISAIKEIVLSLKNRFYNISWLSTRKVIKSPAPFIYFSNIERKKLIQLKKQLQEDNIFFKDGFDFKGASFSLKWMKQRSTIHNNLCLKLVNSGKILNLLVKEDYWKTKEIYQFYINNYVKIETETKNIKIQIKEISDINFIL